MKAMKAVIEFTESDMDAIDQAIGLLEAPLAKLNALDGQQRKRLYKMGNKTEKFCRETLNVLANNRQMVNPTLDLDRALAALALLDGLRPRTLQLQKLVERLRAGLLVLGSDVATAARQGYKDMGEYGAQHNLEHTRQTLAVRYKRQRKPANEAQDEGAA